MICVNCGKEVSNSLKNCPECGASLGVSEDTVGIWDCNAPMVQSVVSNAEMNAADASGRGIGFGGAIQLMFRQYAKFEGRASRSEFWWGYLFMLICSGALGGLSVLFFPVALLSLGLIIPSLSLMVRRLHDVGKSGGYAFLLLVPVVGAIIILISCAKPSDGDNRFGSAGSAAGNSSESETVEEKIYRLSVEHEPKNPNTPEGKAMLDQALSRIIPTYSESENLAKSIMLCNPQDIKANVEAMDKDTLFVILKAFRQHINMGEDENTIHMVHKSVENALKNLL